MELGSKFGKFLKPVIENGLRKIQEKNNYTKGAFLIEIMDEADAEIKEQNKKGVPNVACVPIFALLIEDDVFLINADCNEFSLAPLPGFKPLSQIIAEKMPGLVWSKDLKLLNISTAPTLNFKKTM